uniref:Cytochrome P450 n=1 Tax=Cucumis sativus TaxID=3659 RepID=A0A0A0KZZ2_CUCSA
MWYAPDTIISIVLVLLLLLGWKLADWIWFRPKKLEKLLRQQGFAGNSYRILHGDLKERAAMREEAMSKPMNFSNHIAPRVIPSIYHTIQRYGKNSFMWLGPIPRVHIMDPEQLKTVFSFYNDFQKPTMNPFTKLLVQGIVNLDGEKWVKHRKIINPAFHLEKLKISTHKVKQKNERDKQRDNNFDIGYYG